MKRLFVSILLVLFVAPLMSCSETSSRVSPLISELQPAAASENLTKWPKPSPGTAVIIGILKVEHTNHPMIGVELYLASHIGATHDTPIYSLDPDTAPRAITDNEGKFVFREVPPGRYAVVIWNPFNSFLARKSETGSEVTIDVQPNQIYDIGVIFGSYP